MRTSFIALAVLMMCGSAAALIDVHGPLPPGVDPDGLEREYGRMWSVVAPRQRMNDATLHLFFYRQRDRLPAARFLPEWGGGGAVGPDTIVIPVDRNPFYGKNFQQICIHEIAHCMLNRAYPDARIPRWFHEGVAMTLAGELSFDEMMLLSQAIFFNRLIALPAIDTVNRMGEARAQLAYAQGHAAVLFLIDQYGMDAIAAICAKAQRRHDFQLGLHDETGLDPDEFSRMALDAVRSRYGLMFIFGDNWFWWVGIAVLFLVVYAVTRMRNRKKRREMELEEAGDDEPETETASMADGALVDVSAPAVFTVQSADRLQDPETETGNIDAPEDEYRDDGEDEDSWEDELGIEDDDEPDDNTSGTAGKKV